jgi:integrase
VLVHGRKKGGGTRPVRLPLSDRGVAALRAFIAADAFGSFSTSTLRQVFRRAVSAMCRALEAKEETRAVGEQLRRELADASPYALRHSFLTEVQLATGNPHATQSFALHADARMTRRYTLAAVAPELRHAAALLNAPKAGNGRATSGTEQPTKAHKNTKKPTPAKATGSHRKLRGIRAVAGRK